MLIYEVANYYFESLSNFKTTLWTYEKQYKNDKILYLWYVYQQELHLNDVYTFVRIPMHLGCMCIIDLHFK